MFGDPGPQYNCFMLYKLFKKRSRAPKMHWILLTCSLLIGSKFCLSDG